MSGDRWPCHQTKSENPKDALFMHGATEIVDNGIALPRSSKNVAATLAGTVPSARVSPSMNSASPERWMTIRYPDIFVDPVFNMTAAPFGTGR
jgi:hypothetical protein